MLSARVVRRSVPVRDEKYLLFKFLSTDSQSTHTQTHSHTTWCEIYLWDANITFVQSAKQLPCVSSHLSLCSSVNSHFSDTDACRCTRSLMMSKQKTDHRCSSRANVINGIFASHVRNQSCSRVCPNERNSETWIWMILHNDVSFRNPMFNHDRHRFYLISYHHSLLSMFCYQNICEILQFHSRRPSTSTTAWHVEHVSFSVFKHMVLLLLPPSTGWEHRAGISYNSRNSAGIATKEWPIENEK